MRSVYAKTKREVREKLNKTLTDIQEGTYIEPTSITVGEWLDTWLKEYKINLRPETKASYEMHIRIHLKPDLGKIRLNKLTTHQIQHLYNKLINERGLSPKTVKNVHGALHAALEQAKINGYLRINPSEGTTLPKIEKEELQVMDSQEASAETRKIMVQLYSGMFRFAIANQLIPNGLNPAEYLVIKGSDEPSNPHHRFSKDDIEKMFRHADDPNVQIVLMLIYTGVRCGELIALDKKDVHLEERWFHTDHGKNDNAARDVPIHPAVFPFFERLMNEPGDALVTRFDGKQYVFDRDRNMFRDRVWTPALELTGTLEYDGGVHRPHDTRHTFTSLWKGQKLDEAFRRKIQGHSGHGIGEKVYMLPDIEDLRDELDRLWVPDGVGCMLATVPDSGNHRDAETA